MDQINWSVVSTIFLWVAALIGSLIGLLFNARLETLKAQMDDKVDHEEASDLIDRAIDRYHERIVKDLKEESNAKHAENTRKLDRIYDLLLAEKIKGGMP